MRRCSALALLLGVFGCGEKLAPVSGRITMDGRPLAGAVVTFQPVDQKPGTLVSSGQTDADGRYQLGLVGKKRREGAIPGRHAVEISGLEQRKIIAKKEGNKTIRTVKTKETIPPEYNADSTLKFDVPPQGTNEADFNLQSR